MEFHRTDYSRIKGLGAAVICSRNRQPEYISYFLVHEITFIKIIFNNNSSFVDLVHTFADAIPFTSGYATPALVTPYYPGTWRRAGGRKLPPGPRHQR